VINSVSLSLILERKGKSLSGKTQKNTNAMATIAPADKITSSKVSTIYASSSLKATLDHHPSFSFDLSSLV